MTTATDVPVGPTEGFRVVKPQDRTVAANQTPGMLREAAVQTETMWAGLARTDPGTTSGWHHHSGWNSVLYVVAGAIRIDYGPGGKMSMEGEAGDYLFIPAGAVHRESNPLADEQILVVFRTGSGAVVVNVDEPIP